MGAAYLPYIQFSIFMGNLGFFSNAFFGFILVYLTLFYIKRQFGSYYLLVNFQVLGFVFASFEFLFHTFLHTYNASLTYFSLSRPLGFSNFTMEWMMGIYTGLYSATICMLAIQFMYRYWAIFDTPKLCYFQGWYYFIWVGYYTFFGVLWAFAVGNFFAMDDFGRKYLEDEILLRYERNITEIPVLGLIAYEGDNIRWRNVYGLSLMTLISTVQYSIIIICGHQMYSGMRTKIAVLSAQHRRLHRQFFRALVIQISAPTIILFCPVFFMIYAPFADLEMSFPSCIIQSGFTVYPALDSVIMMSCVSEYGRALKSKKNEQFDYFEKKTSELIVNAKERYTVKATKEESRETAQTHGKAVTTKL
ncbi:LOW QUALITY PROTEIN: Protein CBR-STR-9 [Caenorhabditis briggsae]|uniref:Protein CBR-STR-9 n=1 Tax=Caenorhabditis briggsae TaxID=6238 RepID=A8XDH4_CAEBR|nr:LOW QUALITY PROTEIN: Protein CBR-STR-9 [Caenorhabditis briggsae]CAP30693.2 Protein CBR-STR-9 [Caenorhabditis briggsae]